jgi:hypothetical protein
MGLETFKLPETIDPSENFEVELEKKEKEVMEKVKEIFRENAELNKLLLDEEDSDLSEHQKRYFTGQLTGFRRDAQDAIKDLRSAVPLQYKKAA